MSDVAGAVIKLLVFLPLVALLAYASLKWGLGRTHVARARHMRLIDQLPLGSKARLCVVKVNDRYLLLAVNDNQTNLIQELPSYPESELEMLKLPAPILSFLRRKEGDGK